VARRRSPAAACHRWPVVRRRRDLRQRRRAVRYLCEADHARL